MTRNPLWYIGGLFALTVAALAGAVLAYDRSSDARVSSNEPAGAVTLAQDVLTAVRETDPVPNSGDAADDPAIWVHPTNPALSTIIGTDKKGGIAVYGLDGRQIQYRADGRINNVDLRNGFQLGSRTVTLVAASNRSKKTVDLYRVDPSTRRLVVVPGPEIESEFSPYGLCLYRSPRGAFSVIITSRDGEVVQFRIFADQNGRAHARTARSFEVGSTAEGCVVDDQLGYLYVAEEDVGIWRYGAEPAAGSGRTLVDRTGAGGHLESNVEGLAIAYGAGAEYLVASSQGNDSFVVYRRGGRNEYVGRFEIAAGSVDEVTNTDGIDVTSRSLGPDFPGGLFVAQDGRNEGNQTFKLVRWDAVVNWVEPNR